MPSAEHRAAGAGRTTAPHGIVFLDRDGTIVRDAHYLGDPARVELLPGAAQAIAALNAADVSVIVVTNQSGIARGYLTAADYERVNARMLELLACGGARVAATYYCPHHPTVSGPCACRKPGTQLFRDALRDAGGDPKASFYIGDRWRDVAPALVLGGCGILVPSPETPSVELERATHEARVAATLAEAVAHVLASRGGGGAARSTKS